MMVVLLSGILFTIFSLHLNRDEMGEVVSIVCRQIDTFMGQNGKFICLGKVFQIFVFNEKFSSIKLTSWKFSVDSLPNNLFQYLHQSSPLLPLCFCIRYNSLCVYLNVETLASVFATLKSFKTSYTLNELTGENVEEDFPTIILCT